MIRIKLESNQIKSLKELEWDNIIFTVTMKEITFYRKSIFSENQEFCLLVPARGSKMEVKTLNFLEIKIWEFWTLHKCLKLISSAF